MKNNSRALNEYPQEYIHNLKGALFTYIIKRTSGEIKKQMIYDFSKDNKIRLENFDVSKIFEASSNTYLLETKIKGSKYRLFKVEF